MKLTLALLSFLIISSLRSQDFPAGFIGHWEGELEWYQPGKKAPQKVKMQLVIQPTDSVSQYTWQIIYGDANKDNRPYILKAVDTAKGHWMIDERNGIVLDQYWIANRFTNAFTVQKSTILDSYYIEGECMIVEFYSFSSTPVSRSGGTDKDIPFVDSYATKSYQKAVLKKKK